ncbi:MAG: drug/metabolite transporter (DMT)-like permease [Rickettsiales bacterium]|jgi:drug/metabolite transporter (DMT)-like permease
MRILCCMKINNQIIGILWMIVHCFLISSVVTIAKLLGQRGFSEMQIVFFHSFVALLVLSPLAISKEGKILMKTNKFSLHLSRGVLGVVSLFLYFFALKSIPLTDGRAIALFSPVITFIFAVIFFKEKIDLKKGSALILSLIGGYIIINPAGASFHMMSIFILAAMIMWSIIDLIIKKLSATESSVKQLFYLVFFLSLFSAPFAIYNWKVPENSLDIFLLIFIGVIFLVNSLVVFLAIKHADLTILTPIDFSGMIFTAILSYFVFSEIIKINTLIGSMIVFLSSIYLIYQESRARKELARISEANIQKE